MVKPFRRKMSFRSVKKPMPTSVFFNLFLVFSFFSSFFVGTQATGFDPCTAYQEINDPYRSTTIKLKPGIRANCDFNLRKGWYRFTSIVGGQIPNTKPEPFYCNTIAPIWIRGELPKTKGTEKTVTACINFFNLAGGCKRRFPISVKYCDGDAKDDFYVYELLPVRGCAMAYCAGNKTPCPRGMSGIMPKCNVSQIVEFPYKRVPRPKIDYVKNIDTLALSCQFDFPALGNVSFAVEWFADGKLIRTQQMCVEDKGSRCKMDDLEFTINYGVFEMGQNLQCRLKMKYSTSTENKWSMAKYSNIFFVGIEVTPRVSEIVVKECEKATNVKINLRPTVPIVYLESMILGKPPPEIDHLNLTLLVPEKYAYQRKHIGVDTCSVQLRTKDIIRGKNITIKATCDNLDEGSSEEKFQFHLTTETTYPPWLGYRPPALVIKINTTERRTCSGTGDPHYVTFDGRKFDFYQPGVYLMYSNAEKSLEVQARLWICIYERWDGKIRRQVSCNCGVAIRERNDIVVFSVCNEKLLHEPNERKPIRYSIRNAEHKPLADGFHIYKMNKGNSMEYNVLLPSGTRVRVYRSRWGLDIYIDAPNTDKGRVSGFCGNYNNDTADDLIGKDGKLYANDTQFAETWSIPYVKSYFHTDPAPIPPIPSGMSCTCPTEANTVKNNTVHCEKTENYYFGSEWKKKYLQLNYRTQKKRSADRDWYSDDIIDHVERSYFVDDLQVQTMMNQRRRKRSVKQTMSKEKATKYCRSHIEETKAGRSCKDVSAESIETAMEHCIIDLELSGDTAYAYSAFDFMSYECKEAIFKNISLYTTSPDGDLVPPTELVQDLCPGDCSGQGNCTNQTCICNEGFTAQDCSMKVGAVPLVLGIYNGGLCDIRERPCRKTNMLGENFVSSENLTCHVQEIEVFPGPWSPRGHPLKLHGDMYDLYGVKCDLPDPPTRLGDYDHDGTPAGGLLISVSNDGFNASVQKTHVSYDSKCINCSISDNSSKCERKPNSCLIRGHCFAANEPNPRDWCQQCLPRDDENAWTRRKINHAPKFTTNTTMFALRGENIVIQLKATDPDNRPVMYALLSSTASGYTFNRAGLLRGKVTSNEKFSFKVTDECGAFDTTDMRLRIVQCPCLNGGQCVPHPYYPRGSGRYQCKCVNGFSGDRCERCPGLVCPPRNLSVTTLSSTKIKVKWVEPQDNALDYYLLEYSPKGQKPSIQRVQRVPKIKTSWTLTGLRKFTDYRIGVTVVNANRKKTVEVSAKTDEDVPDASPVITAITPVSHDTMEVTWSPIAEPESNGIIKGYRIYYKPGLPDGSWGRWKSRTIRDGKATSATISRLKPATQYCFKMSAFTRKGQYRLWMVSECWSETTPS